MAKRPREDDDALSLLRQLRSESGDEFGAGLATLSKLLTNVLENPEEERFRTIRLANPTFHARLGRFAAGLALLRSFGFEEATATGVSGPPTHLAIPVADAHVLAQGLVMIEASRQADALVASEAKEASGSDAGSSGSGGGSGGSGSGSAPPHSNSDGKRPMAPSGAAAADAASASGSCSGSGAFGSCSGSGASGSAYGEAAAPSFELEDYGADSIDSFFRALLGDDGAGVATLPGGEEAFRRLAHAALDAADVTRATSDDAARARAEYWLGVLRESGTLLGWEEDDEEDGGDDDDEAIGGRGAAQEHGGGGAADPGIAASGEGDADFSVAEDGNFDVCAQCGEAGELVCCEACPQAFHAECLGPLAPPDDDESDWFCPQCARALGMA